MFESFMRSDFQLSHNPSYQFFKIINYLFICRVRDNYFKTISFIDHYLKNVYFLIINQFLSENLCSKSYFDYKNNLNIIGTFHNIEHNLV